jgi:hypothetical protein
VLAHTGATSCLNFTILARLPNNTESRRAADHIDLAYKYACEAREKKADR